LLVILVPVPEPEHRARRLGVEELVVVGFVGFFVAFALTHPNIQGDTIALIRSVEAIRDCLAEGAAAPCSGVEHFALFQHIPALLLSVTGLSEDAILRGLAWLNTLAFVGLFLLGVVAVRARDARVAPLFLLLLTTAPLLWYVNATFAEMSAAFTTLLYTAAIVLRKSWLTVAASFWLAGITKETAMPFLVAIGLIGLFGRRPIRLQDVRPQLAGMFVGSTLVALSNIGFNLFRYDSPYNTVLLEPHLRVPSHDVRLSFFAGLWASPNGGLVFFAPAIVAFLACVIWLALRECRSRPGKYRDAWPSVAILGILLFLSVGFSGWWAPFGWIAWGPRLLLPWLPSLVFLAIVLYAAEIREALRFVLEPPWRVYALAVAISVFTLPQLAVVFSTTTLPSFFAPDSVCPRLPDIAQEQDLYYQCLDHFTWTKSPMLLTAMSGLRTTWGLLAGLLYVATVFALCLWVRREAVPLAAHSGQRASSAPDP
jgi:hypothetical protein